MAVFYRKGGVQIGLTCNQYLLLLLLLAAVLMDFTYDRIWNGWIVFGIIIGLSFRILEYQWHGLYGAAVSMLISFVLLYPIYKIGGLGAGDVKLFLMLGSFVSAEALLRIMAASFAAGAILSMGKLISEKNLKERMWYFFSYLADVFYQRQWKLYGEELRWDYRMYVSNKIHFALPVLIGVALWMGGFY